MSGHTPGPWEAKERDSRDHLRPYREIVKPIDERSCYALGRAEFPTSARGTVGADERAANARLMAAAPELAEALEATVQHVAVPAVKRDYEWQVHGAAVLDKARAALKKAGRLP